ncbi:hypothetical protein [Enterobacter hormaechei]|uniref:hypothetical protein n=1 Tax=Enterobacter hormaechei TaxID=158836 RepID=UPI001869540F|nr:hypothetical protein [Enterobacter hormaechei]HAT7655046.1 hypothetical protein [Enterobacter hormaechei]
MQASAYAFVTPVGPVSVSATGLFARAGQRFCLWNPVGPVSVSATGLFAGWHYVYPAYIVPTACTAVNGAADR